APIIGYAMQVKSAAEKADKPVTPEVQMAQQLGNAIQTTIQVFQAPQEKSAEEPIEKVKKDRVIAEVPRKKTEAEQEMKQSDYQQTYTEFVTLAKTITPSKDDLELLERLREADTNNQLATYTVVNVQQLQDIFKYKELKEAFMQL